MNRLQKIIVSALGIKPIEPPPPRDPKADFAAGYSGYSTVISLPYDGEKNLGEIGPVRNYYMSFYRLRARSWQSFIESEITQTVIKKYIIWAIGTGLRLRAEPETELLKLTGVDTTESERFNEVTERYFKLWAKSKRASYNHMMTLDSTAKEVKKNAILGGDVLVRVIIKPEGVSVQVIDGGNVVSPISNPTSARINHGVEVDKNGKHVAFHVRKSAGSFETERIAAYTSNGIEVAFMVYGARYRTDDTRGIPLISVVLETLSKLERYKEATVGSAEERAKIPYFIKHELGAVGENPLTQNMMAAFSGITGDAEVDGRAPVSDDGKALARTVATTTNKQTFNLPPGSDIVSLDSRNELMFKEFYDTNIDLICSALCIPPDVARSMYNSNFSASRAALKDWEHVLKVERADFTEQFYAKVYRVWLFYMVMSDKISAPGYAEAFSRGEYQIVDAYSCCRFDGDKVPHIDPEKEVRAERLKLGDTGANIPLTTVEDACERLDTGDSDSIIQQYSEEIKQSVSLGIPVSEAKSSAPEAEPPAPAAPAPVRK